MARRHEEIVFSSDSFLDVVANLVGILIILIVLTGVRVARAPVVVPTVAATAAVTDPPQAPPLPVPVQREEAKVTIIADHQTSLVEMPEPVVEEIPIAYPPLPVPQLTDEVTRTAGQLQAELDALRQREVQARQELQTLQLAKQQLEQGLTTNSAAVQSATDQLALKSAELETVREQVQSMRLAASQAQQALGRIVSQAPPVEELKHQLTPVSRVVTGNEIHFILINNHIAPVPMMPLVEDLKRDIETRKQLLLTRNSYHGSVGPMQGFAMDYVLQRDTLSLAEEMKYGRGIVRMSVTGWILKPQPNLELETIAEALEPGSNFQHALRVGGPTSTVTFWVYPDSFEVNRALKQFAHETGFWVASRPLPAGVPISGGPQGSASMAQ